MPGKNLILHPKQVLFLKGDDSNGMFILRKGELLVYLEKEGEEIELARITPGGMIGEMALFDKQARSASVKASEPSEVTHITNADFHKLIKQIPKWFTSLMITLSTRLRTTNEKVQELSEKLESIGIKNSPIMANLKYSYNVLTEVNTVWLAQGRKSGKSTRGYKYFIVEKNEVLRTIKRKVEISAHDFEKIFKGLGQGGLASIKGAHLITSNKTALSRFLHFFYAYLEAARYDVLPTGLLDILDELTHFCNTCVYDPFIVSLDEIRASGIKNSKIKIKEWDKLFPTMHHLHEDFKIIKVEKGEGFKLHKKEILELISHHKSLFELAMAIS